MLSLFKNRQLFALALGHFGVDMYPNILPVMYPLLVASLGLSYTMIGVMQLIYTAVYSLGQPLFGYLADRYGGRYFAVGGVLITSIFTGMIGLSWNYPSLIIMLALGGIGIAVFHPQGAMNTAAVTTSERRASAMSIYMLGGSVGFAAGPMIGVALLATPWGLHSTPLLVIPGALIAFWLWHLMIKVDQVKRAATAKSTHLQAPPVSRRAIIALVALVAIVMTRSWATQSLNNFLPLWYDSRHLSVSLASQVLFVMLMATAAGGLLGGYLADRFGRRRVVAISLFLGSPALFLFLSSTGVSSFFVVAVMGLIFGSSNSVTLVMAQELLPRRMGVASGLILGLAFITGGLGVAVTGWLADNFTLATALNSLILLPLLGGLICLVLPLLRPAAPAPLPAIETAERAT